MPTFAYLEIWWPGGGTLVVVDNLVDLVDRIAADTGFSGVMLEGFDAGVSFRTVHDPSGGVTYTVLSNTSMGAWPIARRLDELLAR